MTFSIKCEWSRSDGVRTPELAATWCRLEISLGSTNLTLVRDRESPHSVRESIDVAAYPLAEFLATNWWALVTPSHRPKYSGVALARASDGFPWPAIFLRSDRGQMWISAEPVDDAHARVEFLTRANAVLEADVVVHSLSAFIDSTVRRLEDLGVQGTLLQDEWAAIQGTDSDERDFALAAAAWGFDPYEIKAIDQETLFTLESALGDAALVTEMARIAAHHDLSQATDWIQTAEGMLVQSSESIRRVVDVVGPAVALDSTPWKEGYRQARTARKALELAPLDFVHIDQFVGIATGPSPSPMNIDALVRTTPDTASAVVSPAASPRSRRFLAARAVARKLTEEKPGVSFLTSGSAYTDRIERAFAAEFLAPADGIRELLEDDYGDESVRRVADKLNVSVTLVTHQIENQLAA